MQRSSIKRLCLSSTDRSFGETQKCKMVAIWMKVVNKLRKATVNGMIEGSSMYKSSSH
jgi:hypothetical protein